MQPKCNLSQGAADERCPACLEPWAALRDEYVAVLECQHAICARCLAHMYSVCEPTEEAEDPRVPSGQAVETRFQCPQVALATAKDYNYAHVTYAWARMCSAFAYR